MKSLSFIITLAFLSLLFACQENEVFDNANQDAVSLKSTTSDEGIKIAILSDLHYMAPDLLVNDGDAFQAYLNQDPKLLMYSKDLLQAAATQIISQKPDLVLIPGDLTKDGESISHDQVLDIIKQFISKGIRVLVTVGNHDVNNPEAVKFDGVNVYPVSTVQANKVRSIYPFFGFANSLAKDPNSLSYVSEPVKDLWVISIDANEYYNNTSKATIAGIIKPETLLWIKDRLAEANRKGKTVIGMMHHGLIEHYTGQQTNPLDPTAPGIDPGYVIDNWQAASDELIDAGLRIIFTGHYHATDITKKTKGDKFLFDVETGSILTYPCTYRMLTIKDGAFTFSKQTISLLENPEFSAFAREFLSAHLEGYFHYLLNYRGVPDPYAGMVAPAFRDAAMAHFAGDEVMPASVPAAVDVLNAIGASALVPVLYTFFTDINTPDNDVTLTLSN